MQLLIPLVLLPLTFLSANAAMDCCPPTELLFNLENPLKDSCERHSNGKLVHFWVRHLCIASVCEDLSEPTPCCAHGCDASCCKCKGSCREAKKSLVSNFKAENRNSVSSVHINQRKFPSTLYSHFNNHN